MMVAITILATFMFMLGTASLSCILILSLCNATPGFLKRRNPLIHALQYALLILLKLLGLIAFLLSLRLFLIDSESSGQKQQRKRENHAEPKHDMFQHFYLLKIVN